MSSWKEFERKKTILAPLVGPAYPVWPLTATTLLLQRLAQKQQPAPTTSPAAWSLE